LKFGAPRPHANPQQRCEGVPGDGQILGPESLHFLKGEWEGRIRKGKTRLGGLEREHLHASCSGREAFSGIPKVVGGRNPSPYHPNHGVTREGFSEPWGGDLH